MHANNTWDALLIKKCIRLVTETDITYHMKKSPTQVIGSKQSQFTVIVAADHEGFLSLTSKSRVRQTYAQI